MTSPLDWSLVGVLTKVILAASIVALLVALLWVRERSWWVRVVPISLVVGLLVCVGGYLVVNDVWKPEKPISSFAELCHVMPLISIGLA